ncbi:peptidoglycan DD-metalloendopeptidase family protein [Parasutterella secunda]|uniref:Peptidoglycan DD-metalloendopeptidase family protein n=1 Tax=Parasutterella secunda TaxID=626947 RepID=A0ABS2GUK1_9BURK|nr:peptidoglycan DD-metalloendopeptidase family protein [Parasutterella secunda]MBM6929134.1 peptidoglycan DD-metalloendopeptidase family protein [Parasutterella secunda]
MSAPSILAKNLRAIGQGLCLVVRGCAHSWSTVVKSPYRKLVLGITFGVLPASVAIATYTAYPSDDEQIARSLQTEIVAPLPIPAIADQITVVTTPSAVTTHTTMIRVNDTLGAIFSRLNIEDAALLRFIRGQTLAQPLSTPREGVYVQAKVTANQKAQTLKIFLEARSANQQNSVVTVTRRGDRFVIHSEPFVYETQQAMRAGIVKGNLIDSAKAVGVPDEIAKRMPIALERAINNGLDITDGDDFRIIFERQFMEGDFVRNGKILAVSLTHQGKNYESFWAEDGTRNGGFYNLDGTSSRTTFIRVPVEGARVTSSFMPMRRHPVTGVLRPHQGTDFGAPRGNKIFAAADGVISRRSFDKRGFGNYLMIKHDDSRTTLYGHMSRIAQGMKVGTRVKRGQVIGYVGATGLATGPHLHYELRVNNRQVNPLKTNIPDKEFLTSEEKQQLLADARPLVTRLAMLNRIQSVKPLTGSEAVAQQNSAEPPK